MHILQPVRLVVTGTVVSLAALFASSGTAPAYGAVRQPARAAATSYGVVGNLTDVTAVSRTEAWAAGWTGSKNPKTLLLHWNGRKWSPVTSPKPVPGVLLGLTKVSASSIWAVGYAGSSAPRPLVLHWNGRSWRRVAGVPAVRAQFNAIGQAGRDLLAVGGMFGPPMLNMERIGGKWKKLPVPAAPGDLTSLVVTGSRNAWAAGVTANVNTSVPNGDVLRRWNGKSWRNVSFPLHGTDKNLWHLAAGPGGAVWAVGDSHNGIMTKYTPLSMVWNGKTWRKVAVPAPANSLLLGATFVPRGTAWAAGTSYRGKRTLILRWTGKAWRRVATPNRFSSANEINAVAATSPGDAWAVGGGAGSGATRTLILHWNGRTWS